MVRMQGLVDCDNFFVSCERTVNADLLGKAVVILSNNDGCVIARSNEAKALGIKMGVPRFEIDPLVNSGQVTALSGNHNLYTSISRRVHGIFHKYVPRALDYSVDEAFLDMEGIPENVLVDIGKAIREECMNSEHIPVTVGFAPTKVLCKLAVESIKRTTTHVRLLNQQEEIDELLKNLPTGELWGVGRRLVKRLYSEGVYTAYDFAIRPRAWIRQKLGVTGERIWLELHGESCIDLSFKQHTLQESISETRTFPFDTDDFSWIESRIAIFSANCARRLRAMQGECGAVKVFLQSNRFRSGQSFYSPSAETVLPTRTDDTHLLTQAAIRGLREIYRPGIGFKRAGVVFSAIKHRQAHIRSLFDEPEADKQDGFGSEKLMATVDNINREMAKGTLKLASEITWDPCPKDYGSCISFGFRPNS